MYSLEGGESGVPKKSDGEWIKNGKLWEEVGLEKFDPINDRVMICGSEEMTAEIKNIFMEKGCEEGSTKEQGNFVIEKAFAEK